MTEGSVKGESNIIMVPVMQISANKCQPRKSFDKEALRNLAKSIEYNGILQPLTVRRINSYEYELISGERRLRAAVLVGLSVVPCIVVHCSMRQSAVYSVVENIQREELNIFEQAEAIKMLIDDFSYTEERIARHFGKRQGEISNKLKLLNFNKEERALIIENSLCERSLLALLKIGNNKARIKVLNKVIDNQLNPAQIEEVVERLIKPKKEHKNQKFIIIISLKESFSMELIKEDIMMV